MIKIAKIALGSLMGGAFGFAGVQFGFRGDWGLVALTTGLFLAILYLVRWMVDLRYPS